MLGKVVIPVEYKEIKVDEYYEKNSAYRYSGYIVGTETDNGTMYKYINYNNKQQSKDEYQDIQRVVDYENKDEYYLIFKKDNKYGVIKNENIVINNEYDNIEYDSFNQLFTVKKDGKYGVLKSNGETLISCLYDEIDIEGIYIYSLKGEEQIIFDTTGAKIENPKYKSVYNVEDTNYKITINNENKYGVVDENNNEIIKNEYYYIGYLGNNYFVVSGQNGKNGIMNNEGKVVLEVKYDTIEKLEKSDIIEATELNTNTIILFNKEIKQIANISNSTLYEGENFVKLYSNNEQKYFDYEGNEKENKEILNNKLFADVKNGKWGFIDSNGNVIVDYIYDNVTEFNSYGFAGIKKDGKWGSINDEGKVIIEPTYTLNINTNEIDFIGEYYKYTYGYKKFNYTNDR